MIVYRRHINKKQRSASDTYFTNDSIPNAPVPRTAARDTISYTSVDPEHGQLPRWDKSLKPSRVSVSQSQPHIKDVTSEKRKLCQSEYLNTYIARDSPLFRTYSKKSATQVDVGIQTYTKLDGVPKRSVASQSGVLESSRRNSKERKRREAENTESQNLLDEDCYFKSRENLATANSSATNHAFFDHHHLDHQRPNEPTHALAAVHAPLPYPEEQECFLSKTATPQHCVGASIPRGILYSTPEDMKSALSDVTPTSSMNLSQAPVYTYEMTTNDTSELRNARVAADIQLFCDVIQTDGAHTGDSCISSATNLNENTHSGHLLTMFATVNKQSVATTEAKLHSAAGFTTMAGSVSPQDTEHSTAAPSNRPGSEDMQLRTEAVLQQIELRSHNDTEEGKSAWASIGHNTCVD